MVRWEYKMTDDRTVTVHSAGAVEKAANLMGAQGWRLVNVVPFDEVLHGGSAHRHLFFFWIREIR